MVRDYPDVDITDRTASYSDHHKNLAAHLATNNGAADIEAVDVGYINQIGAGDGCWQLRR